MTVLLEYFICTIVTRVGTELVINLWHQMMTTHLYKSVNVAINHLVGEGASSIGSHRTSMYGDYWCL